MIDDTHPPHAHEPAQWVTCKHCGKPIQSEQCNSCDGFGRFQSLLGPFECKDCNGTGIKRWVEVK